MFPFAVSILPKKVGFKGSEMSTKAVLFVVLIIAYSFPSKGSVHPQISLPSSVPSVVAKTEIGTLDSKS